jgi:hypothetical protein
VTTARAATRSPDTWERAPADAFDRFGGSGCATVSVSANHAAARFVAVSSRGRREMVLVNDLCGSPVGQHRGHDRPGKVLHFWKALLSDMRILGLRPTGRTKTWRPVRVPRSQGGNWVFDQRDTVGSLLPRPSHRCARSARPSTRFVTPPKATVMTHVTGALQLPHVDSEGALLSTTYRVDGRAKAATHRHRAEGRA